jgi:hypothetical protein
MRIAAYVVAIDKVAQTYKFRRLLSPAQSTNAGLGVYEHESSAEPMFSHKKNIRPTTRLR